MWKLKARDEEDFKYKEMTLLEMISKGSPADKTFEAEINYNGVLYKYKPVEINGELFMTAEEEK